MKIQVQELRPGDVIMPPARELQVWMRRTLADRHLPESALYLTVTAVEEAFRAGWLKVTADQSAEWLQGIKPYPFKFLARPETPWIVVRRAAAAA
jgi:hypothetical protein